MGTYLDYLADSKLCNLIWPNFEDHDYPEAPGWRLLMAVLMVTVVRSGLTYSFGVFVVQLNKEFHRPMIEQSMLSVS